MKNISYIIPIVCLIALLLSCKDEERIRIPEFQDGANMRLVLDPAHRQINSTSVATDFVQFDLYSENKDLSLVEIFVHYKTQTHLVATYTQSDFADGVVEDVRFTGADLASWFGVPGFGDGTRGGNFVLRPRVTLNDGRVYPSWIKFSATDSVLNIATDIMGSANGAFSLQTPTAILCPAVDISGAYTVISSTGASTDDCCQGTITVSGNTVQITPVAGSTTNFRVSDLTGGIYFEWYDVYGITGPDHTPGILAFNCNEVLIVNSPEPFGTNFQGEGLWDSATSTLTYTWGNGYGDQSTVTLRRN